MLVTENCCRFVIFSWLVIIRCIFLSIKKITVKIFPYISLWCFWLFQNQTFQDRQCAAMNTLNTCSINCGRKKTKYTLSNRGEMIIMRLIIMFSLDITAAGLCRWLPYLVEETLCRSEYGSYILDVMKQFIVHLFWV